MPHLTMVVGYYDQPNMLRLQLATMSAYSKDIKERWRLIVVDDASPNHPAEISIDPGFPVSLFRVKVDVPWNDKGARNIGVHESETPWLLLTDLDHLVPPATAKVLAHSEFNPSRVHTFARARLVGDPSEKPHPNSFFLHRDLWNKIGGCDERLSGIYGGDNEWRGRAMRQAQFVPMREKLQLVDKILISDAGADLPRRSLENQAKKEQAMREIDADPVPVTMTHPYERVA